MFTQFTFPFKSLVIKGREKWKLLSYAKREIGFLICHVYPVTLGALEGTVIAMDFSDVLPDIFLCCVTLHTQKWKQKLKMELEKKKHFTYWK